MTHNLCISDKEYEIAREAFLYENTKGLKFVLSKMVDEGISENRAREIMDNVDSLHLMSGKTVVVRKRHTSESIIGKYLDIRAIILGVVTFILLFIVLNIDKIIVIIFK